MSERKYIAISLKHSDGYYPFVLWGYHRTQDDEERCFAGYTEDINNAELYTIEEFKEAYGNELGIYKYNPLTVDELMTDFKKLKKQYDTVFVSETEYRMNWGL